MLKAPPPLAPIYYLLKVNKNDLELFKKSDLENFFFIVEKLIQDKENKYLVGRHGYVKARLISKSFDKNKLIAMVLKLEDSRYKTI